MNTQSIPIKNPEEFDSIGTYANHVREIKGITQIDVVNQIKALIKKGELEPECTISRGYLSQLEAGKYLHPSPHKLKALAHIYNIPYELMLNKAGYWDKTTNKLKKDAEFTLMLKEVEDMTLLERESVLDYIDYVKSKRNKKT